MLLCPAPEPARGCGSVGHQPRQLSRELRTALEAFADHLWTEFQLQDKLQEDATIELIPVQGPMNASVMGRELDWLRNAPPKKPTDLTQLLLSVQETVKQLATDHNVLLEIQADDALPKVAVHPVALSQTLVSLLSAPPCKPGLTLIFIYGNMVSL